MRHSTNIAWLWRNKTCKDACWRTIFQSSRQKIAFVERMFDCYFVKEASFILSRRKSWRRDPMLRTNVWISIAGTQSRRSSHIARTSWQSSKEITWLSMFDALEDRASRAKDARCARGSNKLNMRESRCVYKFLSRLLKEVVFNSS